MTEVKPHEYENLYWITLKDGNIRLATLNADKGYRVYTERLIKIEDKEYRTFDPYKSKLGAAIWKGVKNFPFKPGNKILYLGAASGTTVSHISDIIVPNGQIFAVEFSPRSMRDLVTIAERRKNIYPILADARFPEQYTTFVPLVDIVYEDVAQPSQAEILNQNVQTFLKKGGYFFLAVKARSIDVVENPTVIFKRVEKELTDYGLKILEVIDIEPYEKDHVMIVGQKV